MNGGISLGTEARLPESLTRRYTLIQENTQLRLMLAKTGLIAAQCHLVQLGHREEASALRAQAEAIRQQREPPLGWPL